MTGAADNDGLVVRTAVVADLAELQRIFREASLSNPGDVPGLLAHPEYLVFTGAGIAEGRTRVAVVTVEGSLDGWSRIWHRLPDRPVTER